VENLARVRPLDRAAPRRQRPRHEALVEVRFPIHALRRHIRFPHSCPRAGKLTTTPTPPTSVLTTLYGLEDTKRQTPIKKANTYSGIFVSGRILAEKLVRRGFLRQDIFFEHLLFPIHQRIDVVRSQFKSVTVCDCIRRACFHAVPAEDAARIVDVVDRSVALAGGNPIRIRIFCSLNVNAIRWACSSTQKTSDALLKSIFVTMQHVNAAVARLEMHRLVWIVLRDRLPEHIPEGHAEPFHHSAERREHFAEWRSHNPRVYQTPFERANSPRQVFCGLRLRLPCQRINDLLAVKPSVFDEDLARMPPANHNACQIQSRNIAFQCVWFQRRLLRLRI